jgi:hypothetical protein
MMPGARRALFALQERKPMDAMHGLLFQLAVVIAMMILYALVTRQS